ncbi:hypothetical protein J4O73_02385 [Methylobacterium sp. NFXW15]
MFMQRTSDGLDWYENWAHKADAFDANDVLATVLSDDRGAVIQCVLRATLVQQMPVGKERIIVIRGVDPTIDKPHRLFEQKGFDETTLNIVDLPAPVVPVITYKKDIWVRATDAEADTIEQVLAQQTTRKQNIFRDATYLDHAEPLFAELMAGFVVAFGEVRAGQLLAGS